METGMWKNSATQTNSALLQERGMHIIGPGVGRLASGADGLGRMAESDEIFEACRWVLGRNGTLAGCQVIVTAGGTWEPFDPVRFIGNRSSGKMGFALANIARDRGGDVTLIHAPTALSPTYGVQSIPVETALQMHDAVMDKISATDVLLMAAAVADYRPALLAEQKIKKARAVALLSWSAIRTFSKRWQIGERQITGPGLLSDLLQKRKTCWKTHATSWPKKGWILWSPMTCRQPTAALP